MNRLSYIAHPGSTQGDDDTPLPAEGPEASPVDAPSRSDQRKFIYIPDGDNTRICSSSDSDAASTSKGRVRQVYKVGDVMTVPERQLEMLAHNRAALESLLLSIDKLIHKAFHERDRASPLLTVSQNLMRTHPHLAFFRAVEHNPPLTADKLSEDIIRLMHLFAIIDTLPCASSSTATIMTFLSGIIEELQKTVQEQNKLIGKYQDNEQGNRDSKNTVAAWYTALSQVIETVPPTRLECELREYPDMTVSDLAGADAKLLLEKIRNFVSVTVYNLGSLRRELLAAHKAADRAPLTEFDRLRTRAIQLGHFREDDKSSSTLVASPPAVAPSYHPIPPRSAGKDSLGVSGQSGKDSQQNHEGDSNSRDRQTPSRKKKTIPVSDVFRSEPSANAS